MVTITPVGLSTNASADVIPVHELSPTEFYCQKTESQSALEQLMADIAGAYPGNVPNLPNHHRGSMCCAMYSADGCWYRAIIEEDHGTTLKV